MIVAQLPQRRRQVCRACNKCVGWFWDDLVLAANARESVEQDRRGGPAADEAGNGFIVRPPDPHGDRVPAIKTGGPGVAIAVRRTGLEGETIIGRIVRWR